MRFGDILFALMIKIMNNIRFFQILTEIRRKYAKFN